MGDHKNDEEEGEVEGEGVGWLALEIKHFFDLSFALFFQEIKALSISSLFLPVAFCLQGSSISISSTISARSTL